MLMNVIMRMWWLRIVAGRDKASPFPELTITAHPELAEGQRLAYTGLRAENHRAVAKRDVFIAII
jgi:hypothetical protein